MWVQKCTSSTESCMQLKYNIWKILTLKNTPIIPVRQLHLECKLDKKQQINYHYEYQQFKLYRFASMSTLYDKPYIYMKPNYFIDKIRTIITSKIPVGMHNCDCRQYLVYNIQKIRAILMSCPIICRDSMQCKINITIFSSLLILSKISHSY